MFAIVFIFLVATVVAVFAALLTTFLQVAFTGPQTPLATAVVPGRLPLLSGHELKQWAMTFAESVVAQHTRGGASRASAVRIATALQRGTSQLLDRTQGPQRVRSDHRCANRPHLPIAVTVPEALAIADELRQATASPRLEHVRKTAKNNAERVRPLRREELATAPIDCPLASDNGECVTYAARPLACRGRCPECAAAGKPCPVEQPDVYGEFATTLGAGVTAGLTTGLNAAGLDGQLYELNSALAVALDTPNAAARWAAGEPVFAGCKQMV